MIYRGLAILCCALMMLCDAGQSRAQTVPVFVNGQIITAAQLNQAFAAIESQIDNISCAFSPCPTASVPINNSSILYADNTGHLFFGTTLPSGLTYPSPIFTGTITGGTFAGSTITNSAINGGTIANLSAPLAGGSGGTASTSLGPEFTSTGGSGSRFDIASGGVTSSMLASGTANAVMGTNGSGAWSAMTTLPSALTIPSPTISGTAAPAPPSGGWTLYSDSGENNQLKAKNSAGIVTTLSTGNPAAISFADYGAIPDGQFLTDPGVTASTSSPTVVFTSASFTSADVGKSIFVGKIGAASGNFVGTIAAVNSTHSINLSSNPGTALAGGAADVSWGTDNATAINNATAAARALAGLTPQSFYKGVSLICNPGIYWVGSPLNFTALGDQNSGKPITVLGSGCTIIGQAVTGVILDALGDTTVTYKDIAVFAGENQGNASIGLQIGRYALATTTDPGAQATYNSVQNIHVMGVFSTTAFYNFGAEDFQCLNSNFYNFRTASGSYGLIEDGVNHWNAQSTFQTQVNSLDTAVSFDNNTFQDCHTHNYSSGTAAIWLANNRGLDYNSGIIMSLGSGGDPGVELYTTTGVLRDVHITSHMETPSTLAKNFIITGTGTPTLYGFVYTDPANLASTDIFALNGPTSVTFDGFRVSLPQIANGTPTMFDDASKYNLNGADVFVGAVASTSIWPVNPPTFNGRYCAGTTTACGIVLSSLAGQPFGGVGTLYNNSTVPCVTMVSGVGLTCLGFTGSVTKTADYTITANDNGRHFDNVGAAGTVNLTLPTAANGLGMCFLIRTAQTVNIKASGSDVIVIGASSTSAGGTMSSNAVGNSLCIEAHGTVKWWATSHEGTWTGS